MAAGPTKHSPPLTASIRAWLALAWEAGARLVWPAVAAPGVFVVLALFGAWERLGDPWRALGLVLTLGAAVVLARRAWSGGRPAPRWPSRADVLRRLEDDSALHDRPFEALDDQPTHDDPVARALWRAHQEKMRQAAKTARARAPKAALAEADPFALRGALALALALGAVAASGAGLARLSDAFSLSRLQAVGPLDGIVAWIDPPAYTGRPPIFLAGLAPGADISAPQGSTFVVRATGAARAPTLRVDGAERLRARFTRSGPGAFEARAELTGTARVSITGGRAAWRVRIVPDTPPTVAFAGLEPLGPRQELVFKYALDDDYGATRLALRLEHPDGDVDEVEVAGAPLVSAGEAKASLDLGRHRWAGLSVTARLVAYDARDQGGLSPPLELTVPERVFAEPLARALQHERRLLVRAPALVYAAPPPVVELTAREAAALGPLRIETDGASGRIDRAPQAVVRLERALSLLTAAPELFAADVAVQLGLEYVQARVRLAREAETLADLPDLLWGLALRAEGGELADAERALRQAQRALADALARGADEAEIMALTQAYEEAVKRYMTALAAEALEAGRVAEAMESGPGGMSQDQIAEMLKALRELAETGSTDDARRLLQALNDMLLNLQMFLTMGGSGGGETPQDEALREAFEALSDLIGEQRELMDETQQRAESGADAGVGDGEERASNEPSSGERRSGAGGTGEPEPNASGDGGGGAPGPLVSGEDLAADQEELLKALQELTDAVGAAEDALRAERLARGGAEGETGDETGAAGSRAGDSEDALTDALGAMAGAGGALESGELDRALSAQGMAVERLREAAESLARQALETERAGRGQGQGASDADAGSRDPLGRPGPGGTGDGDNVSIPGEIDRQRARDILDLLRERLEDPSRPEEERSYLRRLLDRF